MTGRAPGAVVADRGYGKQRVETALRDLGVRHVVLPTKGKPTTARRQVEQRRAFKRMVRWRTGCEGRISCVKRDFGLNRTRYRGLDGATWQTRKITMGPHSVLAIYTDGLTEARNLDRSFYGEERVAALLAG